MASSVFLLSSTSRFPSPRIPNCRNRDTRILPLFPIQKPLKCVGFSSSFHSKNLLRFLVEPRAVGGSETKNSSHEEDPVGEDSAAFELGEQKPFSWVYFTVILGSVLYALDVLWIDPSTGYGAAFVNAVSAISDSHEVVILVLIFIFAIVHSGLASFRDAGEKLIGERAYRVLFAGVSLPLALSSIGVPGVHEFVWLSSFISFFFLYPSTFNLLEVAAVDKPKMHLWETGIIRITRHPQMVGQVIWCLAHTLWIGNSVAVATSIGLIGHHLFGVWNGDRRLALRYGDALML
ncbi:hypothetical protein HPP92_024552 [Vanilla planifolia]|uniref:NnrU domain-containing protein n=1 Tax=Vanilla planifolia TaxID=51239 RepID=A0A835UBM7_VANPL|nr:hypothetical protein HPP92_024552 [Vanilla planifolia]